MNGPRSFPAAIARGFRSLRRRPGYFALAVSSLAIALGLATTVIAQIDSLMHPFTPIKDVDQLVRITQRGVGITAMPTTNEGRDALLASGLFESVVAAEWDRNESMLLVGTAGAEVAVMIVDPAYQELVGMTPRLGRLIADHETRESHVVVVNDHVWRKFFADATGVQGATLSLISMNGSTGTSQTYSVIGVAQPEWYPNSAVIWVPRTGVAENPLRGTFGEWVAKLKPDVRERDIETPLRSIADRWSGQFGRGRPPFGFETKDVRPDPLQLRDFHKAMIGAAFFIVIIASANVAALSLARAVTNRRDQALRLALGAGRGDLVRDVTAEVLVIALVGAVGGIAIAYASMGIMSAATPVELRWLGFVHPVWNARVFAGLFAAVLLCVGLAAIGPAWFVSRVAPAEPLKDNAGTTTGRSRSRFQLLIIGELALSMILLFGASLIAKSAHAVRTYDFGYDPRHLADFSIMAPVSPRPSAPLPIPGLRRTVYFDELDLIVARLRTLSEVRGAAWYASDNAERGIVMSEATAVYDSSVYQPYVYRIGPGFIATLGVDIVEGRDVSEGDRAGAGAVLLDQRAARSLFPDGSPIGRLVKLGPLQSDVPWMPVVGVTRAVVHALPTFAEVEPRPVIYVARPVANQHERTLPSLARFGTYPRIIVRATREARDATPPAQRLIKDLLPPRISFESSKWSARYDTILAGRAFTAGVFIVLSLASLALAVAGLYGVLSYTVGQRMREFALRIALGAQKPHMLRLVFRDSLVMALGGTAIGALIGLYAGFAVYDWLWGVYPVDATALVIAESVLLVVTITASALPALRATRANPADVMRAI